MKKGRITTAETIRDLSEYELSLDAENTEQPHQDYELRKENMGTATKIPDLRFKFGNAILIFKDVKEMEESDLMSKFWDVKIQIENAMRKSKFVKTNRDGDIVSVLHIDIE